VKKWVALLLVLCMVFALSGVVAAAPQKDGGKSMPPGQQKKIDAAGDMELKGKAAKEAKETKKAEEKLKDEESDVNDEADETDETEATENENGEDEKPVLERKHHFKDKVIGPPAFVLEMQRAKAKIMEQKKLKVRGRPFESELPPVIKDGRVLIPVRAVANGLKADVDWNGEEKKITITKGEIEVILYLDSITFYVNGEEQELDVPAMLLGNNRTFVPLRFIAVALGEKVDYDPDTGDVDIGDDEDGDDENGNVGEEEEGEGEEEETNEDENDSDNPDEQENDEDDQNGGEEEDNK
jgi:hypothetical protein